MKPILCSLLVATLPFGSLLAAPTSKNAKVTVVYQHELSNVPGKSIKGVLVEYGPGAYSPGHTHAKSAFIYATVVEGTIRSQINDGPVTVYKAGQSFSELPSDRHGVSANASATRPAELLAVFVVDTNETKPTISFANTDCHHDFAMVDHDQSEYEPFWAAAAALDLPLSPHKSTRRHGRIRGAGDKTLRGVSSRTTGVLSGAVDARSDLLRRLRASSSPTLAHRGVRSVRPVSADAWAA